MSEARKYHLDLIVANQFTTQLSEEIRDAVFGNMGTIVAFRIGQVDVEALSRYFQPTFDGSDLVRVPNYNTVIRTLVGGVPTQPFSMSILPPLGQPNEKLANALRQLSAAKYGRPRSVVESEIFARLATKEPATPSRPNLMGQSRPTLASSPSALPPVGPSIQPKAPAKGSGSSFLDEWLNKRASPGAAKVPSPWSKSPAKATVPPTAPAQLPQRPSTVAAKPKTAHTPAHTVKPAHHIATNRISHHEEEKAQADELEKKVKEELKIDGQKLTEPPKVETPKPPAETKPTVKAPTTPNPSHGVSHIRHEEVGHENTIYIDRDGNFSYAGTDEKV